MIGIELGTSKAAAEVVMGGKTTIIHEEEGERVGGKEFN